MQGLPIFEGLLCRDYVTQHDLALAVQTLSVNPG
jgi:hypothetical protein